MTVNGRRRVVDVDPYRPLRDVLRDELALTGTKEGCETGVCGACTVLLDGTRTKSCLVPVAKATDREVTTAEGLAGDDDLTHVQAAFVDCFASQCGYCMPGFVVATHALLDETPDPSVDEIREGLRGNLCRCTGYVKIVDAVREAAARRGADA